MAHIFHFSRRNALALMGFCLAALQAAHRSELDPMAEGCRLRSICISVRSAHGL